MLNLILKISVIYFLGQNCPITQNSTIEINHIYDKYNSNELNFVAYFPNADSNIETIKEFKEKYKIQFECKLDTNQLITKKYKPTTLPEVIVLDSDNNKLYQGKIDDLYFDIGKRRNGKYKKILDNKLDSIINGLELKEKYVMPIGCVIEKSK